MGTTPKIRSLKDNDLRILILEKLIMIYTVVEKTKTIYLLSIVDQRQDYINILNGLENVYRFFMPIIYGYLYR